MKSESTIRFPKLTLRAYYVQGPFSLPEWQIGNQRKENNFLKCRCQYCLQVQIFKIAFSIKWDILIDLWVLFILEGTKEGCHRSNEISYPAFRLIIILLWEACQVQFILPTLFSIHYALCNSTIWSTVGVLHWVNVWNFTKSVNL